MVSATPDSVSKTADPHLEKFEQFAAAVGVGPTARLLPLRRAALARFTALGFPTVAHEDWRFTNVAPIARLPFRPCWRPTPADVSRDVLDQLTFARLSGPRLVFVNGLFRPDLSTIGRLPPGVRVGNLGAASPAEAELVAAQLGQYARPDGEAFTALNTAFFADGTLVQVPAGTVVEEPVRLVFLATARESGTTLLPRNLILVEPGARLTVIESCVGLTGARYFTNAVTEIVAGDEAQVEYLKFQDEAREAFHVAALHARLGRNCRFVAHSFALGARLSRANIRATLAGEGLEAVLNGLYLTAGDQLADHHMVVEHAQPRCASHEYFNGILDDKSKGVFHGRILVQPVAQKTDAKQTNKNLLLSDDATVDTKPQLEIYADDVRCTHGATVGQLDEDSIYYLRSRGIGRKLARQMLIHAFAGEIIDRVRCEAARAELDRLVWERLEANPHIAETQ